MVEVRGIGLSPFPPLPQAFQQSISVLLPGLHVPAFHHRLVAGHLHVPVSQGRQQIDQGLEPEKGLHQHPEKLIERVFLPDMMALMEKDEFQHVFAVLLLRQQQDRTAEAHDKRLLDSRRTVKE